jgi:DNA-directed RNA polymerase I, II, and III subunit RPABC2
MKMHNNTYAQLKLSKKTINIFLVFFYKNIFLKKIEINILKLSLVNIITMSDDDYFSGGDDNINSDDSDNEQEVRRPPKIIIKPSIIANKGKISGEEPLDDADLEENESIDSDDDMVGGKDSESELDEGEIVNDDDDDDSIDVDDEESEDEEGEEGETNVKKDAKKLSNKKVDKPKKVPLLIEDNDEDEDDEYDDNYLQKFDNDIMRNYINDYHPECLNHNYDEITKLTAVTRNTDGIIVDPLHKTIPYLTKYERARILGQRAKQIETGAKPLVKVPENIIDGYIIAELELREKKIPFIIRRPIPGGGCEYWNLRDLEIIAF